MSVPHASGLRTGRSSLAGAFAGGLRDAAASPGAVFALLLINLLAALALAAPLAVLLSSSLDHNLYGDAMATGASWRWYDTVERRSPELIGDLAPWSALFSEEGVDLDDLRSLAGVPATVAVAGLAMLWLHTLLHIGFLWSLAGGEGRLPRRGAHLGEMLAGAARFLLSGTVLAVLTTAFLVAAYALFYSLSGRVLEGAGEASQREWLSLGLTWSRVGVTLLAFVAVKVFSDLVKVGLIESAAGLPNASLSQAIGLALGQMTRRGPAYLALYLALGLGTPVLAAAWWGVSRLLGPAAGWGLLVVVFLLQQLVVAARIGLRLAHVAATRRLYGG